MTGFRNINLKNNKLRLSFAGLSAIYFSRFNLRLTYPPPIMGSSQGNSAQKPHKTVLRHICRISSNGGSIPLLRHQNCGCYEEVVLLNSLFWSKGYNFHSQITYYLQLCPPFPTFLSTYWPLHCFVPACSSPHQFLSTNPPTLLSPICPWSQWLVLSSLFACHIIQKTQINLAPKLLILCRVFLFCKT